MGSWLHGAEVSRVLVWGQVWVPRTAEDGRVGGGAWGGTHRHDENLQVLTGSQWAVGRGQALGESRGHAGLALTPAAEGAGGRRWSRSLVGSGGPLPLSLGDGKEEVLTRVRELLLVAVCPGHLGRGRGATKQTCGCFAQ